MTEEKTAKGTSKFAGLLTAARREQPEPEPAVEQPVNFSATPKAEKRVPTPREHGAVAQPLALAEGKGPGRPRGKRSDPAFTQVTAYIRAATYRRVKLALLKDEATAAREFSDLLEQLLDDWLKDR